jgi:outer membrane protein TolC
MGERLAAGDISGYAARRVRLEAARYAALAAQAEFEARSERLRLATLLGAPADTALAPVDHVASLAAILDIAPDSIEALVVRNHAGLLALRLAADAGRAEAQLAQRERFPTPIASAGYKNERAPGGDGSLGGFVAGLSFALPIWDRRSGSIASADAHANRLLAEAEAAGQRVVREARTALEAARQTETRIAALGAELGEEAEAALRAAAAAFDEGEITLIEWLDAVRAYHEAESAYASVIAESIIQCATLERLLGLALIR